MISIGYIEEVFAHAQTSEIVQVEVRLPFCNFNSFQTFKYFIFSEFTSSFTTFVDEFAIVKATAPCPIVLQISIFFDIITPS
ncbi:MAG: hypothetical protein LBQ59_04440 [Candidatus Peribacteria bacterium]|jgi:hypothetical protein|nr:hypothetical protein [Candidatus Peribacteria bacterium]